MAIATTQARAPTFLEEVVAVTPVNPILKPVSNVVHAWLLPIWVCHGFHPA